jgi:hypothetical protein
MKTIQQQEEKKIATQKDLKVLCERDREKVKGIFRFYECEGGTLTFSLKLYKWDDVERYTFIDGEIYMVGIQFIRIKWMN